MVDLIGIEPTTSSIFKVRIEEEEVFAEKKPEQRSGSFYDSDVCY
jgi:hypothetical protein